MQRTWWVTLSLIILVTLGSAAAPVMDRAPQTAHAQAGSGPLVYLKDGDIWSWNGSAVTQLSNWGYNEQPMLAATGQWIAYNSWATVTVQAIAAGQPAFGFIPSNIWVMDPRTGDAFRAADQPADAVYQPNGGTVRGVMRGTPAWSPDGSQLAWAELVAPEYRYQLVVFDMASRTTRVLAQNLPLPFADGGFIPVHEVTWGTKGIYVINVAVSSQSGDFDETLYLFDPSSGNQLSAGVIGSSATEFAFHRALMTYNNEEYYGVLYPSGKRFLVEPFTHQQQDMPALPELYSRFAQDNAATAFVAASIAGNNNLTQTWTAVYPNRQNDQLLNFTGEPFSISISPDGQSIAYYADALVIWRNGQTTTVPGTEDVASPWNVGVAWSPTGWRVRTDWPGTAPVACNLSPRLSAGELGQVTPGLPNVIRTQPRRGSGSTILGQIPGGGVFSVVSGPQCGPEGRYWWQVNYQGITGWTAEGESGFYWLQPYQVQPPPVTCTLSPRLTIGSTAYVLPGLPNILRNQPRRGSDSLIVGRIPGNGIFSVLSGPQCGPEGRYWWQVNYQGITGWTAEGESGSYWVAPFGCPASPPPRLAPGMVAQVTPGEPNRLRSGPGTNYETISTIPGTGVFTVLSGPQCGLEGWTYWRVQFGSEIGWTAEGDGSTYWLQPVGSGPVPPTPTPPSPATCGPTPRLQVNIAGRVLPGLPNALRSQPRRGADSALIAEIPGGEVFSVLSGPQCGPEGRYWWQVRWQGLTGWTPEGEGATYWVEPYPGDGPPPVSCTLAPRVAVNQSAYVIPGPSNVIRDAPGTGAASNVIGQIPGGGFFYVIGGPQCGNDGRLWWQINYQGITGWTAEGEDPTYWVAPFQCAFSEPSRLVPGGTARVIPGPDNALRNAPGTGPANTVTGEIPGGASFQVLSGPQCGNEGRIWWYVQYGSQTGWTAEGEGATYWLEPLIN